MGGINIPSDLGVKGHSDGDILIHSIMDSLLGAISNRDIGFHFPSSNMELKNISSFKLLKKVVKLVDKEGYRIANIDSTIILEHPHISKFIKLIIDGVEDKFFGCRKS